MLNSNFDHAAGNLISGVNSMKEAVVDKQGFLGYNDYILSLTFQIISQSVLYSESEKKECNTVCIVSVSYAYTVNCNNYT